MRTLIIFFITSLTCCNSSQSENKSVNKKAIDDQNCVSINVKENVIYSKDLDILLSSCGNYSDFEQYYRIPYNGCAYDTINIPKNKLGWVDILLFPKEPYKKTFFSDNYAKQDSLNLVINRMSVDNLKKNFEIIVFIIEKKYLDYAENVEIKFYPRTPYLVKMFEHSYDSGRWVLSDCFIVNKEMDDYKWREIKIENMMQLGH